MSKFNFIITMVALMLLTGCWEDVSIDRHTFRSTPHLPATIVLLDTTTNEEFWKMDVPVCMRLRLDFSRKPEVEGIVYNRNSASELTWTLMSDDSDKPIDMGQCFFDGCRPFLIKVRYRKSPEVRAPGESIVRSAPGAKPKGMTSKLIGQAEPAPDQHQQAVQTAQAASAASTQDVYQSYSSSGQQYAQPAAKQQYTETIVKPEPQAYAN